MAKRGRRSHVLPDSTGPVVVVWPGDGDLALNTLTSYRGIRVYADRKTVDSRAWVGHPEPPPFFGTLAEATEYMQAEPKPGTKGEWRMCLIPLDVAKRMFAGHQFAEPEGVTRLIEEHIKAAADRGEGITLTADEVRQLVGR